jgi:hypothetical protein
MSFIGARRRIDRLERTIEDEDDNLPIVSVRPDSWDEDVAAAYWAADAAGDDETRHRIIFEQTGQQVSQRPDRINLIVIRVVPRPDGRQ